MASKNSKNVVEINGNLYDANSGMPAATPITKDPTKSQVIDGFVQGKSESKSARPSLKPTRRASTKAHAVHSKTKKSRTLNRSTIKKPKLSAKKSKHEIISTTRTPASRLQRARNATKSAAISKFGRRNRSQAVASAPPAQAPPTQNDSQKEKLIAEQMSRIEAAEAMEPPQKNRNVRGFFRRSPKATSVMASMLLLLVLGGYFVYLNIPNLALRVAAREAGFEANMPGYRPPGYSFGGPISYESGRITIRFNSNTSDQSFAITERQTNWDSQSLLDNHVSRITGLYQTYQERGLTIYVYDGSQATWVNGGIWYSIEGDSQLNTEQLIRIASSL